MVESWTITDVKQYDGSVSHFMIQSYELECLRAATQANGDGDVVNGPEIWF